MDNICLNDVFRKLDPTERSYSYESKSLRVSSRIDFILVSKSISKWVVKANTKGCLPFPPKYRNFGWNVNGKINFVNRNGRPKYLNGIPE